MWWQVIATAKKIEEHKAAVAAYDKAKARLNAAEEAAEAYTEDEAANARAVVAAAAAPVVPRASWWACGLLIEEARGLERSGELVEARKRYVAAAAWQRLHVVANANAARLLEKLDNDLLGASSSYVKHPRAAHHPMGPQQASHPPL